MSVCMLTLDTQLFEDNAAFRRRSQCKVYKHAKQNADSTSLWPSTGPNMTEGTLALCEAASTSFKEHVLSDVPTASSSTASPVFRSFNDDGQFSTWSQSGAPAPPFPLTLPHAEGIPLKRISVVHPLSHQLYPATNSSPPAGYHERQSVNGWVLAL
ncbi:hypothetical protein SAICODRAFT_29779, partial [Saitoella complicata NRRL Y-17804]|uniref:uncharacterized protein n=1 Tax=Saitoella complicata (strain BCRC 22490 / CBS 7301 / JCM 7358 / NBRC 10748 / NRRL Y-17804) TaxID=698492 RepID=UPI000867CA48